MTTGLGGSMSEVRFGLVLPHFGSDPQSRRLLDAAVQAEESGFDSLWVRDRLVAGAPHGLSLEAGGTVFLEPLLTLAAVAAMTDRILLGTAVLLPNRHPVQLLQQLGTLHRLAPRRVLVGLGLGVGPANFESLGLDFEDRRDLFVETVDAIRSVPENGPWSFASHHFRFDDITIDPSPPARIPIYYGGVSRAAVRRALEYADGWIAGRLPLDTFRARMELVNAKRAETGQGIDVATMPITLIGRTKGAHLERGRKAVDLLARSAEGAGDWIKPPSGRFETIGDLSGLLIAGTPEIAVREAGSILAAGATHIIFDLRLAFDVFEEQVTLLVDEVLPGLG